MPDIADPRRFVLALALLACALPIGRISASPALHKCVDGAGRASYQSDACAPGQREAWVKVVESDPPTHRRNGGGPHAEGDDIRATSDSRAVRSAGPRSASRKRSDGGKPRPSGSRAVGAVMGVTANSLSPACQVARRRREQTLERVGLKRTYALLQKLDHDVQQACQ